jgi:peroxiredoxin
MSSLSDSLQAGGGPHNEFHRLPAARAAAPTSKGLSMLSNNEGQRVPDVTFKTRQNDQWVDVKTADLFAGKSVVVFSLPGAYTPTCSSTHLPRFNALAKTFKAHGIDDVVCFSVNDAFVMNEWGKAQEAGNITLIPTAMAISPRAWACWSTKAISASASAPGAIQCWCATA